jgi:DHA3 family macrolide efflux protein-like MFS transporter
MSVVNFEVLKDKNALIIFSSQLVSTICDKMMSLGLIWYLTKNFSINVVPWFIVCCFLPHLLMSFYSTAFINRVGVLQTVIGSEFFRAIVLFFLYAAFFLFKLEGPHLLNALFIAGFLVGLGSSVFNPAVLSLPPQVVKNEKVVGLNSLIDMCLSISTILGATFAIFLLNLVDLKTLILINAISFLWAGVLQLGLKVIIPEEITGSEEKTIALGTMSVLKKYPDIARMLMSFLFLNLIFTPILVMIPWYVQKIYGGDSSALATLEGSMGLGAFLTGIYMSLSGFQVTDDFL